MVPACRELTAYGGGVTLPNHVSTTVFRFSREEAGCWSDEAGLAEAGGQEETFSADPRRNKASSRQGAEGTSLCVGRKG